MKKKSLLLKKKTLLFLMFFCSLMFFVTCRLDVSANDTVKELSYTTPTQNVGDYDTASVDIDFGLTKDWVQDTNHYNATVNLTPIYKSIWITSGSEKINLATEPEILKRINDRVEITNIANFDLLTPVYDNDGNVSSFSHSCTFDTFDMQYFSYTVNLPKDYVIESILKECGYGKDDEDDEDNEDDEYDEYLEVDSVQYSVQFKVKASLSMANGASSAVELSKKSVSGYESNIFYFSDIVKDTSGNYKIVKAKSSDSAIASVSASNGKITLKKPGTCTITVTNKYGRSASFKVKVKKSVIRRGRSSVTCSLGTTQNLWDRGAVLFFGIPKYTVKSSKSSIVSVKKSGNMPIISCKKLGSAVLTFTCEGKKFSVRVKVAKAKIVLASSITLPKGSSRTISANECSDDIYIKKVTSINGLLSVKISSKARAVTLTANKSFSGTSTSDKVVVTFNNGKKKTIKVKITKTKKFSLKDVKLKLKRSYWDGSKACLEYTITNKSSKDLKKLKIFYSGTVDEAVSGYININYSIPRGESVTFTTRLDYFDYIEGVKLKLVSAS